MLHSNQVMTSCSLSEIILNQTILLQCFLHATSFTLIFPTAGCHPAFLSLVPIKDLVCENTASFCGFFSVLVAQFSVSPLLKLQVVLCYCSLPISLVLDLMKFLLLMLKFHFYQYLHNVSSYLLSCCPNCLNFASLSALCSKRILALQAAGAVFSEVS